MKKFIKNIIIFSLPIIIVIVFIEISLRKIPNDYSYKKEYLDQYSNKIEVLYLGNSHTYFGINPEFLNQKEFNAAHISQSVDFDLEILNKYKNEWKNLKTIVLPIDYFSLYESLTNGAEEWRVKNYKIYYGIDSRGKLSDRFELLNGKFDKNIYRTFKYWTVNRNDITCNKLGWGTTYNSSGNKNLEETGKTAALRHTASDNSGLNKQIKALNEILFFAKERNIKVILFTSPVYKTYTENLNLLQLNTTMNVINQLKKKNADLRYFSFLNDKSFVKKDFYDADHLNEIGAKKFTLKMDSIIHPKTTK